MRNLSKMDKMAIIAIAAIGLWCLSVVWGMANAGVMGNAPSDHGLEPIDLIPAIVECLDKPKIPPDQYLLTLLESWGTGTITDSDFIAGASNRFGSPNSAHGQAAVCLVDFVKGAAT